MMQSPFKIICLTVLFAAVMVSCGQPSSKMEQYRAEKHLKDSVALVEQERTLAYFEAQRDSLIPVVDSLISFFKYEQKDPKYQDNGYYVITSRSGLRILVRDDGNDLLLYRNGKRVDVDQFSLQTGDSDYPLFERALHLRIVMSDIRELENRIRRTALEIQKYNSRIHK